MRNFNELPENCRIFIEFIEQYVGVPVKWIGVGEEREALILRETWKTSCRQDPHLHHTFLKQVLIPVIRTYNF